MICSARVQRDAFRRHEPVVVDGGSFPVGTLPRGSGPKHFVLYPDDRIVEATYGFDFGAV